MVTEDPFLEIQAELAAEITAVRLIEAQETTDYAIEFVGAAVVRHMLVCGIAAEMDTSGKYEGTLASKAKQWFDQTLFEAGNDKLSVISQEYIRKSATLAELPEGTPGLVKRGKTRELNREEFITGILRENRVLLDEIIATENAHLNEYI